MRTFDLSSSYNRENLQKYLVDFLPDDYTPEETEQYYKFTNIEKGFKLGETSELDLSVFEFKIKSNNDPKITITKEVALLMKKYEYTSNALVVFYNEKTEQWRFSLITTDYEKKGNKIIRHYSNPKRYSFLLGKDCKKHTPQKMLFKEPIHEYTENGKKITKEQDLKNRFALEVVGKEFFDEYKVFYEDFVQYITGNRYIKKSGKWEKIRIHKENSKVFNKFLIIANNNEELAQKYVRDYIKKMMGRIVFLQFLQKKGWLGDGDKNYVQNLFLKFDYKDDFLEQVLEPLFFGMLNTQKKDREALFKEKHYNLSLLKDFKNVPYLNGGLFESDSLDDITIKFPKELFSNLQKDKERIFAGEKEEYPYTEYCGLLDFFSRYNFTIDESDPSDTEIGVEPEMLGKIFENLLEDNKDKGAFYTPKEIVQYMCRESLISYLSSDSNIKEDFIRNFVLNHDNITDFNNEEKKYLLKKLKDVKICDPAVGSGAFPIGLLKELYMCRIVLEPKETPLNIKKEIVQKNIYGVDIEKGAVDIARLRFWLAIIVDENEPLPLPNLDFKIMQGNSLIESYKGTDLSNLYQGKKEDKDLFGNHSKKQIDFNFDDKTSYQLEEKIEQYYTPNTQKNKHELSNEIKQDLINLFKSNGIGAGLKDKYLLDDLKKIDLHANSEFFLWHTWFKPVFDKGGFDIIIGNPPYIQIEYMSNNLKTIYKNEKFDTFEKKGDIYCLFYEKGVFLLKQNGLLCYISSNKWMKVGYGESLRNFFVTKSNPIRLIDLGANVFENATVDTNILFILKNKYQQKTNSCSIQKYSKDITKDIKQREISICFDKSAWAILNPIEKSIKEKIEKYGIPLKNWDISINYGIKTGCNEAFIIDGATKDKLIKEDPKSAEIIRPILRGKDIKRYYYNFANLYLINSHNGTKTIPKININKYPAIKKHLNKYYKKIEKRDDQGDTPYNLRSCAYMEDFFRQKLVWTPVNSEYRFTLVDKDIFLLNSIFMIVGTDIKFLCYILNSKLFVFYLQLILNKDTYNYGSKDIFNNIFISRNSILKKEIYKIIKNIDTPNERTLREIDDIIYKYYNLTTIEISHIENTI